MPDLDARNARPPAGPGGASPAPGGVRHHGPGGRVRYLGGTVENRPAGPFCARLPAVHPVTRLAPHGAGSGEVWPARADIVA
ncbi:hypothetical protein FRAAL4585 [Frankia alni ACN14a]|uniref:Uncharacterized protein n=1 Tax=Frankia alni (strain DSM 45986 / CECT 9034 / ACN14a) TaxID=326424 RepID=Q0RH08_FRAAA|nr:hypothetical protein FRAAL4585 [Frankia alni ACN14a]